MPPLGFRSVAAALAFATWLFGSQVFAQQAPAQPAPPKAYKKVAVALPEPFVDPSLDAFRQQFADIIQRKDRDALAALVVPRGFFWERESGNVADEKKTSMQNFVAAAGLDAADGSGWDFLADYAAESSASKVGDRQDMVCAPAGPVFDDNQFGDLVKATGTNSEEWGYPLKDGIEAKESAKPDAKVVEKLGLNFIRVIVEDAPAETAEPMLRIVTPSGKTAFVPAETLAPLGIDQLCYVKREGAWKIMGYVGDGAAAH